MATFTCTLHHHDLSVSCRVGGYKALHLEFLGNTVEYWKCQWVCTKRQCDQLVAGKSNITPEFVENVWKRYAPWKWEVFTPQGIYPSKEETIAAVDKLIASLQRKMEVYKANSRLYYSMLRREVLSMMNQALMSAIED